MRTREEVEEQIAEIEALKALLPAWHHEARDHQETALSWLNWFLEDDAKDPSNTVETPEQARAGREAFNEYIIRRA